MALVKNKLINIENLNVKIEKKNEKLHEERISLYTKLAKIIKQFPKRTPIEILYSIHYDVPAFRGNYDTAIKILNIKIKDAGEQLETEKKSWNDAIKELEKNRKEYETANTMYEEYKKKNSGKIEVIFSQAVKNELAKFDNFLSDAFGAGYRFEENIVQEIKDEFILAMRKDIGTL